MIRSIFMFFISSCILQPATAQDAGAFTSARRVYNDASEWKIYTSDGDVFWHRDFTDGSQWSLEADGKQYTLSRTYGDGSEWRLQTPEGTVTLKRSYSDGSAWEIKDEVGSYTVRRTFADGSDWSVSGPDGGMALHRAFSDGSQWNLNDSFDEASIYVKAMMVFVVIAPHHPRN